MSTRPTTRHEVATPDGGRIAFRCVGEGPAVVLLHGAMQTAGSHDDLARELSGRFRVVLPDRRGRGASSRRPASTDAALQLRCDVEDVATVVTATDAQALVGVSSGALIALHAAARLPAIAAVVAFEPPLLDDRQRAVDTLARIEREVAEGRTAAALTTGWLAIELGPAWVRRLPRAVLERLVGWGSRAQARRATDPTTTMGALAATLPDDFRLVAHAAADPGLFARVAAPTLLIGTERSPAYLAAALDRLASTLPRVERVTLPRVGHEATGNRDRRGRPDLVATQVRRFLAAPPTE